MKWDTSEPATADRLRRLYAGEPSKVVYGVKTADAASWHREQDERALARAWLAEHPAGSPPDWTREPPAVGGLYWNWNGDEDCSPVPLNVSGGGHGGKAFVKMGQYGLTHAIDCDDFGGWWRPCPYPPLPSGGT